MHVQDGLRDLKGQLRSHGWRLGQFILVLTEVIFAEQCDWLSAGRARIGALQRLILFYFGIFEDRIHCLGYRTP